MLSFGTIALFLFFCIAWCDPSIKSYGIILLDGFDVLDVFGPLEYINALPNVNVYLIAESSMDPVWSHSLHAVMPSIHKIGEYITPTHTLATAPPLDVLIVHGGLASRRLTVGELGPTKAYINATYPSVKYLLSICTGNAINAASGILDGRRATGNKRSWAFVTGQGPLVNWVPSARWVVDGNIWSSSGIEAGTDMAYAFISKIYGQKVADSIANTIEHAPNKDPTYDPFAELYNTTGTLIPPPALPPIPDGVPTKYGLLIYPGFASLEVWAGLEVLHLGAKPVDLTVIAKTLDPVHSNLIGRLPPLPVRKGGSLPLRGKDIFPTVTLANATSLDLDVLIVPGAPRVPFDSQLSAFIKTMYPKVRYVISIGTGAALVADSGVAKGHEATTSKYFYNAVKYTHPSVKWIPSARWTVSDNGKLWSSSGGISVMDTLYAFQSAVISPEASLYGAQNIEYIRHTNASWDPFASVWNTV